MRRMWPVRGGGVEEWRGKMEKQGKELVKCTAFTNIPPLSEGVYLIDLNLFTVSFLNPVGRNPNLHIAVMFCTRSSNKFRIIFCSTCFCVPMTVKKPDNFFYKHPTKLA